jgi:hypothetical protein
LGHGIVSEALMRTSLFSLLVYSPSTLGYESPWLKEAEDLTRAAEEAERQHPETDPMESFAGL